MEVDAVGPELTELANDLLLTCLGPRFTVAIETVATRADGKGQKEGCWVMVRDGEEGREGEIRSFSGGERVLIGEALNLALSMLGCRRAGFSNPTLIRDETGAALSPEKARVYLAMLRRAAAQTNASKVLFVSHNDELNAMADARVEIRNGQITIT